MDLRLIGAGLLALTVSCTLGALKIALRRRSLERLRGPSTQPTGDPKHLPLLIAPGFVLALVALALGGSVDLISMVFVGTLTLSLLVYQRLRTRGPRSD